MENYDNIKRPKLKADGTFKIKIVERYKLGGLHRVVVATPYGIDNLGLSMRSLDLDLDGVEKWKKEVKQLIEKKYGKLFIEKDIIQEEEKEFDFETFDKQKT